MKSEDMLHLTIQAKQHNNDQIDNFVQTHQEDVLNQVLGFCKNAAMKGDVWCEVMFKDLTFSPNVAETYDKFKHVIRIRLGSVIKLKLEELGYEVVEGNEVTWKGNDVAWNVRWGKTE